MRLAFGLLLALALSGCGGGGGGDDPGGGSVSSGQDVAALAGCTGFTGDSDEAFVTEGGSCVRDGETMSAYYFSTDGARDQFLSIAGEFGGQYLVGHSYLIEAKPATLKALQGELGGDIKP